MGIRFNLYYEELLSWSDMRRKFKNLKRRILRRSESVYYDEEYGWRVKPEYKDLESSNQAKGRE